MIQRYMVLNCEPDGDGDRTFLVPADVFDLDDGTDDDELLAVLSDRGFLAHKEDDGPGRGGADEDLDGILVGGSLAGKFVVILNLAEPPEPELKGSHHCVLKVVHEEVHAAMVRENPDQEFLREPLFELPDPKIDADPGDLN